MFDAHPSLGVLFFFFHFLFRALTVPLLRNMVHPGYLAFVAIGRAGLSLVSKFAHDIAFKFVTQASSLREAIHRTWKERVNELIHKRVVGFCRS